MLKTDTTEPEGFIPRNVETLLKVRVFNSQVAVGGGQTETQWSGSVLQLFSPLLNQPLSHSYLLFWPQEQLSVLHSALYQWCLKCSSLSELTVLGSAAWPCWSLSLCSLFFCPLGLKSQKHYTIAQTLGFIRRLSRHYWLLSFPRVALLINCLFINTKRAHCVRVRPGKSHSRSGGSSFLRNLEWLWPWTLARVLSRRHVDIFSKLQSSQWMFPGNVQDTMHTEQTWLNRYRHFLPVLDYKSLLCNFR